MRSPWRASTSNATGCSDRVSAWCRPTDWRRHAGPYDLILCNPPYVNAHSMARAAAEYRAEPALALAGGADGMDFVRGLLRAAAQLMERDAVLVLEIGNEREHFEAAFPAARSRLARDQRRR